MRWWVSCLLVATFLRHFTSEWLAAGSSFSPAAVFYMLGGVYEVALAALALPVLIVIKPSVWRGLGFLALGVMAVEGLQVATCRFFLKAATHANQCDVLTGLPVEKTTVTFYAMVAAFIIGKAIREKIRK